MRRSAPGLVLGLAAALALGCASAYDQTYQAETQRLEAEESARQAERQTAYDEASRFAAVVYFEVGSAVLHEEGYRELRWFVHQTRGAPQDTEILVQGFADATGADAMNQRLSDERAQAVARFLETEGIAPRRLVVQGFSAEFSAADNATAKGRRNNRRVEITLR